MGCVIIYMLKQYVLIAKFVLSTFTLQGKSAEEIRRIFHISNNFSGEEDEVRNNTEGQSQSSS